MFWAPYLDAIPDAAVGISNPYTLDRCPPVLESPLLATPYRAILAKFSCTAQEMHVKISSKQAVSGTRIGQKSYDAQDICISPKQAV